MHNQLVKHALVVERIDGLLNDLTPRLRGLGFQVARAADAQALDGLLRSLRRLSVLIVNEDSLRTDSREFVLSVRALHPDLPILWLASEAKSGGRIPSQKLDLVATDPQQILDSLTRRVRDDLYSEGLVRQLLLGFQSILLEFSLPTRPGEPYLKASLSTLGEVNAILFMMGNALSGHLILSASQNDLSLSHRAQLRKNKFPELDDLEDLLGEAANQIVGELKRRLDFDGVSVGLPHFFRGAGCGFRHKAGAPSLAVEFTKREQKLGLELCIYRADGSPARPKTSDEVHLKVGEFTML